VVILEPRKEPEPEPDGKLRRFYLIRGYTLLVTGIILVIYGVAPPVDPAVFGLGGTLLGLNPVLKSTEKRTVVES
jgi:hypothetical protein